MILDTSFLHDLMYGDADAVAKAKEIEDSDVPHRLSSMTVYELYFSVGYTDKSDRERTKVDRVIGSKPIVPADEKIMRKAGRLDGLLESQGNATGQSDLIIGATGLVFDEPVLTRNVGDFDRIPDLAVETY